MYFHFHRSPRRATAVSLNWGWLAIALVIVAFAAYLRVVAAQDTEVVAPIRADARQYYNYACNLKRQGVYSQQNCNTSDLVPDAKRNPGYALFLVPFVEHPPTFEMVDRIVWMQVGLSILTLVLASLLFRDFLGRCWSLLSGLLVALSPHLITANVYVLTETLFTLMLVSFLTAISWFGRKPRWSIGLLAGVLLGAALLVRPTMLYFLLFLVPALFLTLPRKRAAAGGLALVIGFLAVYGPWIMRNQSLPDTAVSTKALDTINKGMYPDLMYRGDPRTYGIPNRADPLWDERGDSRGEVFAEIRRRFANEPLRYLNWYLIGKPTTLLSWGMIVGMGDVFVYPVTKSPYFQQGVFDITHRIMYAIHWPVTILALIACVLVWLPAARAWLPEKGVLGARTTALVIGYFLLVHIAGTPLPRYAVPLRPPLFGLGVLGGVLLYRSLVHVFQDSRKDATS